MLKRRIAACGDRSQPGMEKEQMLAMSQIMAREIVQKSRQMAGEIAYDILRTQYLFILFSPVSSSLVLADSPLRTASTLVVELEQNGNKECTKTSTEDLSPDFSSDITLPVKQQRETFLT